jgi:hypothetical protein
MKVKLKKKNNSGNRRKWNELAKEIEMNRVVYQLLTSNYFLLTKISFIRIYKTNLRLFTNIDLKYLKLIYF